jgi:hypothetical protein
MGQTLKGGLEFLPEAVRVTIDLPWFLSALGDKLVAKIAQKTGEVLQLPPPKL